MKTLFVVGCTVALLYSGCTSTRVVGTGKAVQHAQTFSAEIKKTVSVGYLLYLPEGYGVEKKEWPLVLFLHGAGERGSDINLVKKHGPPKLADRGQKFDFIVVSPQCPQDQWWDIDVLNELLSDVVQKYQVDQHRVYLTGLSMGGYGTWNLAAKHPERFAALMPICGGGDTNAVCILKSIPTWVFHGRKDNVVPIGRSEEMVKALKQCGGNVQFTVYPEAGHDSWTDTYDNPKLYEWMLMQTR